MRDTLVDLIDNTIFRADGGRISEQIADNLIANDVVVQEHGYWIEHYLYEYNPKLKCSYRKKAHKCSVCGLTNKRTKASNMKFCPNCGAKMDVGRSNENAE